MRLSFVRLTRFLARLMARPRLTLLWHATHKRVDMLTMLLTIWHCRWLLASLTGRLACELRLARTRHESHARQPFFVWYFIVFFSDGFPYFVAPAFSTPAFSTPAIYSCISHFCIFHPCDMLPHFPLLHFPLPHFQRPLFDQYLALSRKRCKIEP